MSLDRQAATNRDGDGSYSCKLPPLPLPFPPRRGKGTAFLLTRGGLGRGGLGRRKAEGSEEEAGAVGGRAGFLNTTESFCFFGGNTGEGAVGGEVGGRYLGAG